MDISVTSSVNLQCVVNLICVHMLQHTIYAYMHFSTAGSYRFIFSKEVFSDLCNVLRMADNDTYLYFLILGQCVISIIINAPDVNSNTFVVSPRLLIAQISIFTRVCVDVGTAVSSLIDVTSSVLRKKNVGF
jgi:hypothetical protein